MAQDGNSSILYSVLTLQAQKQHSPIIEVNEFLDFFERYVKHHPDEQAELANWATGMRAKFWEELKRLKEVGMCTVQEKGKFRYLYLPKYCAALVENEYQVEFKATETVTIPPFPSELSLKISLPSESFIFIDVNTLDERLEEPPEGEALINMRFPHSLGSILALNSTISSGRLLEAAFTRVRYHLLKDVNQEFFQKKLTHYFHEREEYPHDMLNKLVKAPLEATESLIQSEESSYLLWQSFCNEIKNDLENKKLLSRDEITVLQAAYIIEQFNLFYNKVATKKKEKARAFQDLLVLLGRTPYLFKMAEIIKFVGGDGRPLLTRHYTQQELYAYLEEISTGEEGKVPRLLVLGNQENNEHWYIMKQRLPPLCIRYLLDAQTILKTVIVDRWEEVLRDYETEESMTDASVFEAALWRYLHSLIPPLAAMLEYKQLFQLYKELSIVSDGYTEFAKLINKDTGKLFPLSVLLYLNQKNLLNAARDRLPWWYSLSFIGKIILFFRKQHKKASGSNQSATPQSLALKENPATIKVVCSKLEASLVPEGYTLEWYLRRLYEKWARPLKTSENVEEVNRLVRNRIRRNAPLYKLSQINEVFLEETATGLIADSPSLKRLDQESLKRYIKLYTLKLLRDMRHHGFRA